MTRASSTSFFPDVTSDKCTNDLNDMEVCFDTTSSYSSILCDIRPNNIYIYIPCGFTKPAVRAGNFFFVQRAAPCRDLPCDFFFLQEDDERKDLGLIFIISRSKEVYVFSSFFCKTENMYNEA
jgi:hypothetical protein